MSSEYKDPLLNLISEFDVDTLYKNVKILLAEGHDVNVEEVVDDTSLSPLGLLITNMLQYANIQEIYEKTKDVMELLLGAGADLDAETVPTQAYASMRPLDYLVYRAFTTPELETVEKIPEIVQFLVDNGADVNFQKSRGRTLLHTLGHAINREEQANPERRDFYIAIVQSLLGPKTNIHLEDKSGVSPLELYATIDHFDIVQDMLYITGMLADDGDPYAFYKDLSDRTYIFSQLGGTCASDSFFTYLFFSSATGPYLKPVMEDVLAGKRSEFRELGRRNVMTSKPANYFVEGLLTAIERHAVMKNLQNTKNNNNSGRPTRRKSLSKAGNVRAMTTGLFGSYSHCEGTGISMSVLYEASKRLFVKNPYNFFPSTPYLDVILYPPMTTQNGVLSTLDLHRVSGLQIGLRPFLTDAERIHIAEGEMRRPGGHAVAIFRRMGDEAWVFSDNVTGFLHRFQDQTFVPDHFLPALKTDPSTIKFILFPTFHSFEYVIHTPTQSYPNVPEIVKISQKLKEKTNSLGSAVVFLLQSTEAAGGAGVAGGCRHTRRTRRAHHRRS